MRQGGEAPCCQASRHLFVYWELFFKGMSALYLDSTPPTAERRGPVGAGVKCASGERVLSSRLALKATGWSGEMSCRAVRSLD